MVAVLVTVLVTPDRVPVTVLVVPDTVLVTVFVTPERGVVVVVVGATVVVVVDGAVGRGTLTVVLAGLLGRRVTFNDDPLLVTVATGARFTVGATVVVGEEVDEPPPEPPPLPPPVLPPPVLPPVPVPPPELVPPPEPLPLPLPLLLPPPVPPVPDVDPPAPEDPPEVELSEDRPADCEPPAPKEEKLEVVEAFANGLVAPRAVSPPAGPAPLEPVLPLQGRPMQVCTGTAPDRLPAPLALNWDLTGEPWGMTPRPMSPSPTRVPTATEAGRAACSSIHEDTGARRETRSLPAAAHRARVDSATPAGMANALLRSTSPRWSGMAW